jgi:hypothetical protein
LPTCRGRVVARHPDGCSRFREWMRKGLITLKGRSSPSGLGRLLRARRKG